MEEINLDQFIREIKINRNEIVNNEIYPFSLPIIKELTSLKLHPGVTFIVGENGSGKSTLLEAIAIAYGFNPEGGTKNFNFSTYNSHSLLYKYIHLIKGIKTPKDGFFLRAESMYNLASNIDELDVIDSYGGRSLHQQSHGESFLSIMINRFSKNGLYILDEPEAALSPTRQMSMITRIHDLINENCQFIISTHSPILMSYPNSIIYEIKNGRLKKTKLEDTEHYQITKSFLENKNKFLDILLK
ncbi:AAA family ATPase [Terrisporobacter mayombei]|nr:AAA family ATPase [Terrisporobacter mayombei]